MLLAGLAPDSRAHSDTGILGQCVGSGQWPQAALRPAPIPQAQCPSLLSGHSQPPSGNPPAG